MSLILYSILILTGCAQQPGNNQISGEDTIKKICYVAIGDSYTIGELVKEHERWPNLLTRHLRQNGINIELVANPSRTGWTTQDAIDKELPVYNKSDPDFATLLIGVNDWVQGVDSAKFRSNLCYLMDEMLKKLPSNDIPDFSATPQGNKYSGGRDISAGLALFNTIIKEESAKRDLAVVDIFEISQDVKNNPELVAGDGLHPSGKEYAIWEEMIYPVAYEKLTQK